MDGLLIVDKPSGPTSHDVVARLRRVLREKRIGHTGTLDPMATGVLVLVVGKATRLAKFLSASDKSYDAIVRFGFATDTADAQGRPVGPVIDGAAPPREAIDAALDAFRGTFMQQPPAFSAKKIDGQRSYKVARARARSVLRNTRDESDRPAFPAPASVTTHRIEIVSVDGGHCHSAGGLLRRLLRPLARARPGPAAGRRRASGRAAPDPDRRLRARSGAAARRGGTGSGGRRIGARAAERRAPVVAVRGPDRRWRRQGRSRPGRQADRPRANRPSAISHL